MFFKLNEAYFEHNNWHRLSIKTMCSGFKEGERYVSHIEKNDLKICVRFMRIPLLLLINSEM